uniref:Uncharacterized protein MANES_16G114500 n=1 Tax=Rhizophora mucronata TaxID=61149 RepID=A0A2P2LKF8_RHIMU
MAVLAVLSFNMALYFVHRETFVHYNCSLPSPVSLPPSILLSTPAHVCLLADCVLMDGSIVQSLSYSE